MDAPPVVDRPVLRKCCPEQQHYDVTVGDFGDCVDRQPEDGPWQPSIYAHTPFNATSPVPVPSPDFELREERLEHCAPIALNMNPNYPDVLYALDNGYLYVPAFRHLYSPEVYCIETLVGTGAAEGAVLGGVVCSDEAGDMPGVVALPDDRPVANRCCARTMPLDAHQGCRFDLQTFTEPPPPFEDPVIASGDVRYEIGFPVCNLTDLVILRMGSEPFAIDEFGGMPLLEANVTLPPGEFCLNEGVPLGQDLGVEVEPESAGAMAALCPNAEQRVALDAATVHKCCPPGMEMELVKHEGRADDLNCVNTTRSLELAGLREVAPEMRTAPLMIGFPNCPGGLFEVTTDNFSVLVNGSFREVEYDPYACHNQVVFVAPASSYCLDRKAGSDRPVHAFYCFPETKPDDTSVNYIFYPILMGITDFFLLVTFIVYLTVPDPTQTGLNKKRKLSQSVLGMILLAYISSLFFGYLVLMIVQTANTLLTEYRLACKVLGELVESVNGMPCGRDFLRTQSLSIRIAVGPSKGAGFGGEGAEGARHVPWPKNKVQDPQGPASSIQCRILGSQGPASSMHFRILGSQGPMSSIHFRILGFQGPTFSIPFRIQGSQGPTSGIHCRILGSQGPMTSINFSIQSPQGPTT